MEQQQHDKERFKLLETISNSHKFNEKLATYWYDRFSNNQPEPQLIFDHIAPASAGFLLSLIIRHYHKTQNPNQPRRIWVLAPHLRAQEQFYHDASLWNQGHTIHFLPELDTQNDTLIDPELAAERLRVLHHLSHHRPESTEIIILTRRGLDEIVPHSESLKAEEQEFKIKDTLDESIFIEQLESAGFERVDQVIARNQWARRGGIIDLFPPQAQRPIRIELFGDEIDSLREFDVESQISIKKIDKFRWLLKEPEGDKPLSSWIHADDLTVALHDSNYPADIIFSDAPLWEKPGEEEDYSLAIYDQPLGIFDAGDFVLNKTRRELVERQLKEWLSKGWNIYFLLSHKGEDARCRELLFGEENHTTDEHSIWKQIQWIRGDLSKGFSIPSIKTAILSSNELFGRYQLPSVRTKADREDKARRQRAQASLMEIKPGDLVVHLRYGIGLFLRIEENPTTHEEEMLIEYQDGVRLRLPLNQSFLVSRYIGLGSKKPELNKLGDTRWKKSCLQAEQSVADYAAHLLRIQAERETKGGYAHAPDSQWMNEFENTFPFRETPDQLRAIQQTKLDMENSTAMDRLICGDVGFGKTEVALRAAFKCITGGKQVLMLAPTTVLAEQHFRNFRSRMSEYPIRIELLSRTRTPKETREIIKGLSNGTIDMVIGTHRLISDDVKAKNLGLVVIDEEQRFGVLHKEKFKEKFRTLDILTLSATPIPRTLYLALMGARDMSTIDTPPSNRLPVATHIASYDDTLIQRVITRELERGGQVYFLHNRVKTIDFMRTKIQALVPQARIVIGHGQMDKKELENVMHEFVEGKADILLATTIIESGIDIPNANTIIIDRADRFGLADLYQLRGRVGRSGHQAYAYLLLPKHELTTGDARKRITAIKQYTELGSGFKIAMRDLEIRGAGNLLGTQQSGHIAAIGFELYCQLLKQSIDTLKGIRVQKRVECHLKADFLIWSEFQSIQAQKDGLGRATVGAYIPSDYIPGSELRMAAYKELSLADSPKAIDTLETHWKDRFGPLPTPVKSLLLTTQLRIIASQKNISQIEIKGDRLMLTRNGQYILLDKKQFPKLTQGVAAYKLEEAYDLLLSL